MRYVRFQVVDDEDYGDYGILPDIFRNWTNYSPAIAVNALGHDLVEHGAREYGAFHQEVAAIGGYLFTRLFSGHAQNSFWTPRQLAASDMARTWNESTEEGLPDPPKVIILDKYHNEVLDEFFNGFREAIVAEWESNAADFAIDEDEELPVCPYATEENWPKFLGWLKYGYSRAYRRFKGDDSVAYRTYTNINQVISRYWEDLKMYADTGTKFTLAIDYSTGDVELRGGFF